jgi:competence ComEA-like helix-hairpin-helix protein
MTNNARSIRGFGLVIGAMGLLLVWAGVLALQRTARHGQSGSNAQPFWPDMRIDINRASAAEFSVLPGLGPALSQRVVDDREFHGPFRSPDDLDRVNGIGPALVERIRPYAVVE